MNLTIYSKTGCPYCDKIKKVAEYLNENKSANVAIYTLGEHFTRDQFFKEFGVGSTFPQVILNDEHLGGCMDTVKYLQDNNLL